MSRFVTAADVVTELGSLASPTELVKLRKRLPPGHPAIGNRMRDVFDIAKAATSMPLPEWNLLIAEPTYEARMVAFSVLDFKARADLGSADLMALYLSHHDRITTWDMVDRAAPRVIGAALVGGPYAALRELAEEEEPLRRRTAMTAPLWFARFGDLSDVSAGFEIAALLHHDPDPTVHKAVGIYLAYAGERDPAGLDSFLRSHAEAMAPAARRLATRKHSQP